MGGPMGSDGSVGRRIPIRFLTVHGSTLACTPAATVHRAADHPALMPSRGLPGFVRSRINSRTICTNRGCNPGVSARIIVRFSDWQSS